MNSIPNRYMIERLQDNGEWLAYDDRSSESWARTIAGSESKGRETRVTYNGVIVGYFKNGKEVPAA